MSILKKIFGWKGDETEPARPPDTETVRKIVDKLDHMEPEQARFVAAFAFVLSRVAHADMNISTSETRAMERIVAERGGLSEEQAMIVVQMAKSQSLLFGGTENYLVTRELKRISTRRQKIELLDCLFAVSAADESVTTTEDNVIGQIADQLGLDRSDLADARGRYREYLAVLRNRTKRNS